MRRASSTTCARPIRNRWSISTACAGYLDASSALPIRNRPRALVRGFDYYSRTAFEFISDKLGAQSTVLGGQGATTAWSMKLGGEPPYPGIGFGSGIERACCWCARRASWPQAKSR